MARTKAFDPTRALDRALDLFWCRGYSATSLHDLLVHMDIGRQSLYDTFGDKHQLFLAALDRYCTVQGQAPLRPLSEGGSVRAALITIYRGMVAEAVQGERRGCFLVNTAIECVPYHDDITASVTNAVAATEDLFVHALRHGQAEGEIAANRDVRVLARYLVTMMQGLRVQIKSAPDPAALYPVIDLVLLVLD